MNNKKKEMEMFKESVLNTLDKRIKALNDKLDEARDEIEELGDMVDHFREEGLGDLKEIIDQQIKDEIDEEIEDEAREFDYKDCENCDHDHSGYSFACSLDNSLEEVNACLPSDMTEIAARNLVVKEWCDKECNIRNECDGPGQLIRKIPM